MSDGTFYTPPEIIYRVQTDPAYRALCAGAMAAEKLLLWAWRHGKRDAARALRADVHFLGGMSYEYAGWLRNVYIREAYGWEETA